MSTAAQLGAHLRQVFSGGNWTSVNVRQTLGDISLEEAVRKQGSLNTIAALTFHIHYYVAAVLDVLEGGPLNAQDKYSFDVPHLLRAAEWETLRERAFTDAERLAALIETFPDERLSDDFTDPKYGSYHRNFLGLIEHTHYHLGQIALLKKLHRGA
ncbi:DinB family protein [Flaviaesturariibacter flavus]|uniref:DinB family protein n=1 Tax=Flaviaesturariibacter flavus TaxID=2502780 RepID=A0A4R1BN37_9BACT|nr:DinB family protein [Flaviaesturariibacter flavus]TCJ18766.1 DinB family protein [Flaviaesturariibacter flavus]